MRVTSWLSLRFQLPVNIFVADFNGKDEQQDTLNRSNSTIKSPVVPLDSIRNKEFLSVYVKVGGTKDGRDTRGSQICHR